MSISEARLTQSGDLRGLQAGAVRVNQDYEAVGPPGAPTALDGTAGDAQIVLTWAAPSSNGGSAITDYEVQYRTGTGAAVYTDTFATTANPLGAPWTRRNGTNSMQSTGGQAVPVANAIDATYHYADMASPDHWVEADVRCDDGFAGVQARIKLPFRNEAVDAVINPSDNFALNKHVNNVETELDVASGAIAGQTFKIRAECLGNNLKMFVDGVLVNEANDAALNDGLGVGIGSFRYSGTLTIDNFAAGLMAGAWTTFSDAVSASTGATVTGLTNGTTYEFQVRAINANGPGLFSAPVTVVPGDAPPAAPSNLQAATATSTSAGLTWDAVSGATSYVVQYREHKAKVVVFEDNFDYANGTSLASTAGWDAETGWGTLIVNDGAVTAQNVTDDSVLVATTPAPVDGYVEILFESGADNFTGVIMRNSSSDPRRETVAEIVPDGYIQLQEIYYETSGYNSAYYHVLGQTPTDYLAGTTAPIAMRLEVVGNVARMYLDNVLRATGYATYNMTGTRARTGGWRNTTFSIYRFEMGTFAVGAWLPHSTPSGALATVSGLMTGAQYDFRVAAVNASGQGAFSTPDSNAAGLATPTISTVTPSIDAEGGDLVAVVGTNFAPDATTVTLDGVEHPCVVKSFTTLDFTAPAHADGNVTLRVRTANGDSASFTFTYGAAGPPVFSDDFERADGSLGADWEVFGIVGQPMAHIVSGEVIDGYAAHILEVSGDQYVEAVVASLGNDAAVEIHCRVDTTGGVSAYGGYIEGGSGYAGLFRLNGGVSTGLVDSSYSASAPFTVRLEHEVAGALRLYVNGALRASASHTALSANVQIGFGVYQFGGAQPRIESITGGELVGGPTILVTDNFNRADVSPLDAPWTKRPNAGTPAPGGILAISSNRVISVNANEDALWQHSVHSDLHGYAQVDMRQDNGYMGMQLITDAGSRRDIGIVFYPDGNVHLGAEPGNVILDTWAGGYTAGTTVTVRLEWDIDPGVSADYRGYIDGVLRLEGTSTEHDAGTYGVGIGTYRMGGLTTFDNFEMGTL